MRAITHWSQATSFGTIIVDNLPFLRDVLSWLPFTGGLFNSYSKERRSTMYEVSDWPFDYVNKQLVC